MISYGKQTIDSDDIKAVVDALENDLITQGPAVEKFETEIASYFGSKYCSAVSSGTAALHLIGKALDWGSGDIILTSPITFLASANSILYSEATPDFVDINPLTYNLDINQLEEKVNFYRREGKQIKAVIAVDYAGNPCDWESLRYLADKYDFVLINDNCHSMGSEYLGEKEYAVKYADLVTQSYHPVKHFTTGEGGSVLTNNKALDQRIKLLRSHGMTKEKNIIGDNKGPWYYEMHEVGFNYRITDFQCALGLSQLIKLDNFLNSRREIAKSYNAAFNDKKNLKVPFVPHYSKHSYHLYPLNIDFKSISVDKISFFRKMKNNGILLQVHYIPIHLQPYYKKSFGFRKGDYPNAESFYENEVSIPIYPSLKKTEQKYVIDLFLKEFDE